MIESIPLIGSALRWLRRAKSAGETYRDAKAIAQQAAFDKEKIQLLKQISEAEQDNRKLRRELDGARERILELESAARSTSRVIIEKNAAWKVDGDSREGPFCQTCWGNGEKLIPLTLRPRSDPDKQFGVCGSCKTAAWVRDTNEIEPPDPPMRGQRRNIWDERY